ncbi:bifunctional 4-hydroxy-2-oxoglutarate aldolase/2-dehydro-3-deoxy-phosphogluconate aldolase [Streptomyces sp. PTM05]|uniref:2-dehydro-3-deoxy-phosphogluconate aldolase n=1 Tax=Streptantibioticus parmotrematis TaxID=2873249 RepID=A0ABS7QVP4_9ACTN|nr:bifunctional 4-hydroxy-2-oxoglutarate aldolase/2-dehydro-3-deoxy-phosphogluconate aldolase [Streptantibioticus parmotrematis]MBY8887293.1 bifunctional 4-hydroxy-2-oxoglutarate aldolase/2-dehydro-3-deoxy-phosphogluconate aldolase [Streptantibioticus parmotrematis]
MTAMPDAPASGPSAPSVPSVLDLAPVIPVVTLHDAGDAVPLARALVAGGLPAVEITLRTPAGLDAVCAVARDVPGAIVGAGTVLTERQVNGALDAGARFLVSPGCTGGLLTAMLDSGAPVLPGVATASEAMALLERGVEDMKFFPAEAAGGVRYLRSLAAPLPSARFCATGGIDASRAADYLALPNVPCVGGSWMVPDDAVRAGDWGRVERLARAAAAVGGAPTVAPEPRTVNSAGAPCR